MQRLGYHWIKKRYENFSSSLLRNTVALFIFLVFFVLPFQKPHFHKILKKIPLSFIPSDLFLPSYFSKKLAIYPSEVMLIILLSIVLYFKKKQLWEFFMSDSSKYLTFFLLAMLFSIGCSSTSHYPLAYTRFIEIALVALLFPIIKTAFNADTIVPLIKTLAYLIFALSLFECVIALLQYFSQERMGLKYMGECNAQNCLFRMPLGQRWIFDKIFNIQRTYELLARASGTFPHPNIFGGFHYFALLTTFYLYFTQPIRKYRSFLLLAVVIQMTTLTLIFSRAAILAFALSTAIWFLMQARDKRRAVKYLIGTLLAAAALNLFLFYPQLSARGGIINYNKLVQGADAERLTYQKIAWEMFKERPLLGVGFNNFQIESHRFVPKGCVYPSKVHNIYLLFAAETGLIGVSCFFLFLFSILKRARRCIYSQEGLFLLSLFIGLLFIGLCDFYLISTPHGQILFFGGAALLSVVSCHKIYRT